MKKKTSRTYSISDDIYKEFISIIEKNKINKSKLIESWIIEFIKNNKK